MDKPTFIAKIQVYLFRVPYPQTPLITLFRMEIKRKTIAIICENCAKKQFYSVPDTFNPNGAVLTCNTCKKPTRCTGYAIENPPQFKMEPPKHTPDMDATPPPMDFKADAYSVEQYPLLNQLAFLEYKNEQGQTIITFFPDNKSSYIVGRISIQKPSDIKLDTQDTYINRQHFSITVSTHAGRYRFQLNDYHSSNGTFLKVKGNWKKIDDSFIPYIEHGDIIGAGRTEITFKLKSLE